MSSANGVSKLEAVNTRQSNDRNTRGGQFRLTEHQFPTYNSKENIETTAVSQSKQNKIKKFLETKGNKNREKGESRLFKQKVYSSTRILLIYHFILSCNKKVIRF